MFSKVANVAKENALKYGSIASQKVVEVSSTVSEKVDVLTMHPHFSYVLLTFTSLLISLYCCLFACFFFLVGFLVVVDFVSLKI